MNLTDPQERAVICGQYVIGLLEEAERQEFEQRMSSDPAIVAEVARWQDQLVGLSGNTLPLEPAADLWLRIEQSLPAKAPESPALRTRPNTQTKVSIWESLPFWRGLSAFGLALCLAMGIVFITQEPQTKVYLAVLRSPAEQQSGWIVQASSRGSAQLTPLQSGVEIPNGKSMQFWTKLPDADKPVSLGLIRPGDEIQIPLGSLPGLVDQQLFEITLEPEAGSPTGLPTGPILFVGKAKEI